MTSLRTQAGALLSQAGSLRTSGPSAVKTLLEDFEGGLGAWDRTDNWAQVSTDVFEGTYAAGVDAGAHGSEQYLLALQGSLPEDFVPGKVLCVPFNPVSGGALDIYFGEQDNTPSNQYEVTINSTGGVSGLVQFEKDAGGSQTTFYEDTLVTGIPSGSYGFVYLYWHPEAIADDPANSTPGDATGDLYIEVQDGNHVPKASVYVDAGDTTYTDGGIGFASGGSNHNHVDYIEMGDPGAFPDFNPEAHIPSPNEIHYFDAADLTYFSDNRDSYEVVEPSFETVYGDYCLRFIAGEAFKETISAPGTAASGQMRDLPNYISDGQKGAAYMRTDELSDEQYFGVASDGTSNNYIVAELDYGDRFRVAEWVNDSINTLYEDTTVSWQANQWYELIPDRTQSGQIRMDLNLEDGTDVSDSGYIAYDSSLQSNDGILIGGYTPGTANFYFDKIGMR